jgi:hypothetical protein
MPGELWLFRGGGPLDALDALCSPLSKAGLAAGPGPWR